PLWLTVGRSELGSSGWLILGYIYASPFIFIALWILYILLAARPEVRKNDSIGSVDAAMLLSLCAAIFLQGFFVLDGGNDPEGHTSVAMNIFALDGSISSALSQSFLYLVPCLYISSLGFFTYKLIRGRSIHKRV